MSDHKLIFIRRVAHLANSSAVCFRKWALRVTESETCIKLRWSMDIRNGFSATRKWRERSIAPWLEKLLSRLRSSEVEIQSTKKCKRLMTLNTQRFSNVFTRNLSYNWLQCLCEASVNKQTSCSGFGWARVTVFAIIRLTSWKHWLCSSAQRSPIASFLSFECFIDPASLYEDFSNSWRKKTASAYLGIIFLTRFAAQTNFCSWSAVVGSGSCGNALIRLSSNRIPVSEIFLSHNVISREHRSVLLGFNWTLNFRMRSKDCFKTWR